jgi:very-short-patch-repair endonuclease
MLEWHYRSRDPSLITVSNKEFYANRLILPPTPHQGEEILGLSLRRVPGIYSSRSLGPGRPGTNRLEAIEVVKRLKDIHMARRELSIGIVTFSKAQADMMTEVLEYARRKDAVLDDILREDKNENVFVKNIENVQGDERDVILISVGYGPTEANGPLRKMDFGPINFEGGEKRLNVLFTRSRTACEVFLSFDPSDIDLSRTTKNGPKVLKEYLEFAKSGVLSGEDLSAGVPDSPFEEDVGRVIKALGYEFDYQVGTSGFRIDIGVKDPTGHRRYLMAVECDGATYHSALWARERDRHRQEILENLGWVFHRIWSTDWFYRKSDETERLRKALAVATAGTIPVAPDLQDALPDTQKEETSDVESPHLPEDELTGEPYRRWEGKVSRRQEPHAKSLSAVARVVKEIVEVEGLVHFDEVVRRYASAHGKQRAGTRIRAVVHKGLTLLNRQGELTCKSEFWGTEAQFQNPPIRNREHESSPLTKAEYLSAEEIDACAGMIKSESGEVQSEELIRAVSRILGFKRAGPEIQKRIRVALADR